MGKTFEVGTRQWQPTPAPSLPLSPDPSENGVTWYEDYAGSIYPGFGTYYDVVAANINQVLLDAPSDNNTYARQNAQWVKVSTTYTGAGAPLLEDNNYWFDSNGLQLYIAYDDGNSTQWVPTSPPGPQGVQGVPGLQGPPGPQGPQGIAGGVPEANLDAKTYGRSNGAWVPVLPASGGILTGALTLAGNATANLQPVTLQQLTAGYLSTVAGGTMTGPLIWTATGSTTSRAAQDRSADVANVLDWGADPTGIADSTAAIRSAIATARSVYLPKGSYRITGALDVGNQAAWSGQPSATSKAQTIYGDGLATTIAVDVDFDPAAAGVIILHGKGEDGPTVRDLRIFFHQAYNQNSRANFLTLAQGATSTPTGTGCKYPWAILMNTVDCAKIERVRIEGAWDGIKYQGVSGQDYGGLYMAHNEIGAFDVGLFIEANYNYGYVVDTDFWPYGYISSTNLMSVYNDGNTFCGQIGRSDGIFINNWGAIGTRLQLLSTFTNGQFVNVFLDIGGDLEILGVTSRVFFDTFTHQGIPYSGNSPVTISGSYANVWFTTFSLNGTPQGTTPDIAISGTGTVTLNNGKLYGNTTTSAIQCTGTGQRMLRIKNVSFQGPQNTSTPIVNLTGATGTFLECASNSVATAGTGGAFLAGLTDSVNNSIIGNACNGWRLPAAGPLGDYRGRRSVLVVDGTAAGNPASTTNTTVKSFTIPASMLLNVGDRILLTAGGTFTASTDSKNATLWFGNESQQVFGTVAAHTAWRLTIEVIKTGSNTQTYLTSGLTQAQTAGVSVKSGTATETDTATIGVIVQAQNSTTATANSVVCNFFLVELVGVGA